MTEDNKIRETLIKMAEMALQRNKQDYWSKSGGVKRYIRLNSDGFRLVSLTNDNPCGALYVKDKKGIIKEVVTSDLEELFSELNNSKYTPHTPGKRKREHKLQATIIYKSLTDTNNDSLPKFLGCEEEFEKLMFVDDEFTIGDIRADLIFLGFQNDDVFPVFVELKAKREATRLKEQLDNISKYLSPFENEFISYVKNVTGFKGDVTFDKYKKVAIWPDGGSSKRADHALNKDNDVLILGFEEKYTFNIEK